MTRTATALPRRPRAAPQRSGGLLWLLALSAATVSTPVLATGGSYAATGTGTFAQSLWWLDFTGYNTGSVLSPQALSFTLPSGAGTLSLSAQVTAGMALVGEPAWSGGGAFGHGAYNGIAGTPLFYWLSQSGTGTTALTNMSLKDASGNARTFVFYAADGENTDPPETITYASSAAWKLIDTVNYYALFNGNVPSVTGNGTATAVESGVTAADGNYNASLVFATANPTHVSTSYSGNEATLFAISLPPVTFNVVINGRVSASDQFTAALGYTSPATSLKSVTSSGAVSSITTGTIAVIGTNSITLSAAMAAGSFSPLTTYSGTMACTNSGPGAAAYGGTNTVLPSGTGTSFAVTPQTGDAITCTLTLNPPPQTVAGTVYADVNHNSALDGTETGTGLAGLYVKIAPYSGGACQSPASAAAAVASATGTYSLTGISAGSYCLILDGNNTLTDLAPTRPTGWIGTQNASGIIQLTTVPSGLPSPQNFGLYNGSSVSGTVFADSGVGSGTANNGVQDGTEPGIASVLVQGTGATTTANRTPSAGTYSLWIPATATGAFTVTPLAPSGYLATGGSAGSSGGSYTRPSVTLTPVAGNTYSGVNFGLVPGNDLTPNGAQQAQPGQAVTYAHAFIAGSAGQVTFSLASSSTPATPAWSQTLYLDSNCNGVINSSETVITGALSVTAGQKVCLVVKVQVPAGASSGAQSALTLSAAFTYSNAAPALAATTTANDVTTVGTAGTLMLMKLVSDVTLGGSAATSVNANPGDTLQYSLTATNNGSGSLATLVISDATPSFTTYLSASCPGTLPAGITGCSVSTQPPAGGSGAVQFTFSGSLAPGAALAVTYNVKVAN
jgi:uncharacterized repeat protein (TIGR01451 family)